jgi:tetratricopeptide (TPR) repeat protein
MRSSGCVESAGSAAAPLCVRGVSLDVLTPDDRKATLANGNAALEGGRLADAIALGERVLADCPGDLQALYLIGVARLRRGEFDVAVQLLDRVLERVPEAAPVAAERRRAADALGRRIVEHEVCQEALRRLGPLVADRTEIRHGDEAHVVLATAEIDSAALALAQSAAAMIGAKNPTFWREPFPPIRTGVARQATSPFANSPPPIEPHRHAFPRKGFVAIVGLARSPAAWWGRSAPTTVVGVVDEFMPCEIIARLRELSDEGARRVALLYASLELARRTGLPGRIIGETE